MNQLVADDVIGLANRTGKWHDDAATQRFGDAAGAFTDVAAPERVWLLELRMAGV